MTIRKSDTPPERAAAARDVGAVLVPGRRVVLTTHVNADGDGVGSEVGLWHLLRARGLKPSIANSTGIPDRFRFLVPDGADASDRAHKEVEQADVVVVLDISDLARLGDLAQTVKRHGAPVVCIDHHVSPGTLPDGPRLVAPEASATAELVFDLAAVLGWEITPDVARALYVGILTDTGGFRFANTTPRLLRIAAALLDRGLNAEEIYERVYASAPEGRGRLMAGGVRLALLFRHLANGRVKVSLRSLGEVDVAEFAHRFGGGGHTKAAGASFEGNMAEVQERVLGAARAYLAGFG